MVVKEYTYLVSFFACSSYTSLPRLENHEFISRGTLDGICRSVKLTAEVYKKKRCSQNLNLRFSIAWAFPLSNLTNNRKDLIGVSNPLPRHSRPDDQHILSSVVQPPCSWAYLLASSSQTATEMAVVLLQADKTVRATSTTQTRQSGLELRVRDCIYRKRRSGSFPLFKRIPRF